MGRHLTDLSIIRKMILCIVVLAVLWMIIRWAWLSYDWFPMVKSDIPDFFVPMGLSVLTLLLLWHEINSANDRYEDFLFCVVMLCSLVIFVSAGFIVEDATTKVIGVDRVTDLSKEDIKRANYLQLKNIEPDTTMYGYAVDYYINEQSRGADEFVLCVYQVCPLKDMKGAFVCSETKAEHGLGVINRYDERLRKWMAEFEYSTRGTIKLDAMKARFFKLIRQSDNIEQYMKAVSSYRAQCGFDTLDKKDVLLLEISNPDSVDGYWNNVAIVLVSLIVLMVIAVLVFRFTEGPSNNEYDESREFFYEIKQYLSRNGNIFVLLPPLLMFGWGLYMIFNGYNPQGSNYVLFEESGVCTPASLLVDGEWWRIFSSMFVHWDFVHIIGNIVGYGLGAYTLSYYLYGRDITLVFLISGALSIGFAVLCSHNSVIGASGGVFGLYGAFLSLFLGKADSEWPIFQFFMICVTLIINTVVSFRSDISMSAHFSGFFSGAVVAWIFRFFEGPLAKDKKIARE